MKHAPRILFCILNWGLGHASRSIPLIQELLKQGVEVILASDGRALQLLQKEFPQLQTIKLPAYNVSYRSKNMVWNIAWQLPKIIRAINQEKKLIKQLIKELKIDAIISDNRFGCYNATIPSIFITHQINIKTPIPFLEKIVNSFNHRFIRQFDACWIPDVEESPRLAGTLSSATAIKKKVDYLGILSRMKRKEISLKYDIIIVLSGPEPQRTFLEEKLIQQLLPLDYKILLISGQTEKHEEKQLSNSVKQISFLTSENLNQAILESRYVICRSGYSSLMDLVALQKKAILIPTPGQTEQEYLAKHLQKSGQFIYQEQDHLNIEEAIQELDQLKKNTYFSMNTSSSFKAIIKDFLEHLTS